MNSCLFTVFIIATAMMGASAQLDHAKMKEQTVKLISECKAKVGASSSDIDSIKMHKMPGSKEGLCLLECIFQSSGLMKDGKFSKEGMIEGFKPVMGDDQSKLASLTKLAETCEKEVGDGSSDRCETAKMLVSCIMGHAEDHGFEVPPPHQ